MEKQWLKHKERGMGEPAGRGSSQRARKEPERAAGGWVLAVTREGLWRLMTRSLGLSALKIHHCARSQHRQGCRSRWPTGSLLTLLRCSRQTVTQREGPAGVPSPALPLIRRQKRTNKHIFLRIDIANPALSVFGTRNHANFLKQIFKNPALGFTCPLPKALAWS